MRLLLVWTLLAQQGVQIGGLEATEHFEWLQTEVVRATDPERWNESRVLDAETGLPIGGAVIEAWTEEISPQGPGFRQIGEATSGPDGSFRVRVQEGAARGDKVRARAAGYLALSCTDSDLFDPLLLMPAPKEPVRLKVVDLEDRPIQGARITSTYSCAHDLPAFDVLTDAAGIASLPEWGLQERTPELRVRAAGYNAVESLDESEVLVDAQSLAEDELPLVRLARQSGLRARLVPVSAAPLQVLDGEGEHAVVPAADGRFEIPWRYGAGEISVARLADGQHLFSGRLPAAREVALRSDGAEASLATGTLKLELEQALPEGDALQMAVFHPDGWSRSLALTALGTQLEFPAGEGIVLCAGGAFTGFVEELLEVRIAAGEVVSVRIALRSEPQVTILAGFEPNARAVIQAGDDSLVTRLDASGAATVPVPGGKPALVLVEGERTRRLSLPPLATDATANLRPESCLLPRSAREALRDRPRTAFEVTAKTGAGAPLEGALTARGVGDPTVAALGPGLWRVEGPAGAPLLLHLSADGYADLWRSVAAPRAGAPADGVEVAPTALATLQLDVDVAFEVEGPLAERLDALHPGPLSLVLRFADRRRLALALHLKPGEARVVTVRAYSD